MLQNNSTKVSIIKFTSGEEIVCNTHGFSSDSKFIKVSNGLTFVMGFNPEYPTQGEVSFSPWLVGSELSSIKDVYVSTIVTIAEPSATVKERYSTALGIATQKKENPTIVNKSMNRIARK